MKKLLACLLASVCLLAAAPRKPKLILAIVLDQFRYDYTTRFRADYSGGFDRLLTRGAVYTNASFIHFPTVTAVGHSTFLSGALPAVSGIVGNQWYDRGEGRVVTSVSDPDTQLLGGSGAGSSPRRMLVDTVGDELKLASAGKSRVIGISLKDRAAILPAGHTADAAYWFDSVSGGFVSSTYYFSTLPAWVADFNATRPADRYRGVKWLDHTLPATTGRELYSAIEATPFSNELEEQFAERAIENERLGQGPATDLLAISFSAHDYVGHQYGPYSPEEHETSIAADKLLDRLFQLLERRVGMANVLVVLTADHGVAPAPGSDAVRKMPGGRIPPSSVIDAVQSALSKRYGAGSWVSASIDLDLYLNLDLVAKANLDPADVRREAARAVAAIPHIFRVYTRDQLLTNQFLHDEIGQRVMNSYYERRGADIELIPDPYWILSGATGTTHGTPFGYDAHVPVIFLGTGIRPGRYDASIAVNDIAPTLATILDVETPSGSVGRVLAEMFE
jgi:hypothetical protein